MPSLGMYTTEGTLTAWLRPPGSEVTAGEPIIEITTEKAAYQIEAPAAGLFHAVADIGAVIADQGVIGYVLAPGEAPPAADAASAAPVGGAPASPAPASPPRPESTAGAAPPPAGGEVRASPVARRLAREQGIDITTLVGTGPGGRIVEADVVAAASRGSTVPAPSRPAASQRIVRDRIPLVGMRRTIGERLRSSLSTTAPVTLTREVDAEALVGARERLKPRFADGLPYDAFFVKLVAAALGEHPELNAVVEDDAILLLGEIHVGVAVAVPGGLLVPVVRDADRRALGDVAAELLAQSARAKAGQLRAEDMAGGTFTITNLGGYGVDAFSPIINPPQAAILGIGRILPRAVVRDGHLVARQTCVLSLTFDHRVADGAPAAQFLDAIARRMGDEAVLDALA
jgi:pyruvate dehydrogenase E2 component (dihydrolipoamide acetyltransferase)